MGPRIRKHCFRRVDRVNAKGNLGQYWARAQEARSALLMTQLGVFMWHMSRASLIQKAGQARGPLSAGCEREFLGWIVAYRIQL